MDTTTNKPTTVSELARMHGIPSQRLFYYKNKLGTLQAALDHLGITCQEPADNPVVAPPVTADVHPKKETQVRKASKCTSCHFCKDRVLGKTMCCADYRRGGPMMLVPDGVDKCKKYKKTSDNIRGFGTI